MKKNFLLRVFVVTALTMALTFTSFASAFAETNDVQGDLMSAQSTEWTSTTLKAEKVDLKKVSSYSYNKIKLTWEPFDDVDGYQVYRSTSKNGSFKKIYTAGPDKSTYINSKSVTTGTRYYYKVRAFKKINGKTVYTKYSNILSNYARPSKVKITDAYGNAAGILKTTIEWKPVSGASRYEIQLNQKKNEKWTGWRNYTYERGKKETFDTYYTLLAKARKTNKSGVETTLIDGKMVTLPLEEYVALSLNKNQAWIELTEDDSIYKFRARAYRNVNGKKVYGAWSDEYTLEETLNPDEILAELRQYTIDYAKKNYPEFQYDDDTKNQTPENSGYYVDGAWAGFSMYARQDEVIESYKDNIERYVRSIKLGGGEKTGFLYIRKSYPGDREGISYNVSDETYYAMWMLH